MSEASLPKTPLPKTPIRYVVSDVDGTLVTKDKRVTKRTEAAIAALHERGVAFTIISARPPQGLHHLVDVLKLAGPVAAVNGGALIRSDLSVIERKFVPEQAARATVRFLRERGMDPWLYTETEWFLRDPAGPHVEHEMHTLGMGCTAIADFDDSQYTHCLKIVGACDDHELLARCEAELQAELGATASATRSQSYYLDITHPDAFKGKGLQGLARLLEIEPEAVMAVGDGINDISMLKQAGFSVAMGNGAEAVKATATVVTSDNEHDGLAEAIERYVLGDARHGQHEAPPHLHESAARS